MSAVRAIPRATGSAAQRLSVRFIKQLSHCMPVATPMIDDQCKNLVCDVKFSPVNFVVLAVLVVAAGSLMLFALKKSGGWGNHWCGHRPVTWFVLALIVPELAVILIAIHAVAERRKSKRRTQRTAK
jgi:hypothetical protein